MSLVAAEEPDKLSRVKMIVDASEPFTFRDTDLDHQTLQVSNALELLAPQDSHR